jgi:hypothetical protein
MTIYHRRCIVCGDVLDFIIDKIDGYHSVGCSQEAEEMR